jgi:hypothetical protein
VTLFLNIAPVSTGYREIQTDLYGTCTVAYIIYEVLWSVDGLPLLSSLLLSRSVDGLPLLSSLLLSISLLVPKFQRVKFRTCLAVLRLALQPILQ